MKRHIFFLGVFLILNSCESDELAQVEAKLNSEVNAKLILFEDNSYKLEYQFKFDAETEMELGSYSIMLDTLVLYPKSSNDRAQDPYTYGYLWQMNTIKLDGKIYTTKRVIEKD
jgi:hypothetical protein